MLKINEIIESTKGNLVHAVSVVNEDDVRSIVIDSREANEGSLFVALKGEKSDGHSYLKSAYNNGCRAFLVNKGVDLDVNYNDVNIIEVADTELALGDIAKYYKSKFNIPFIGVTGSVGKTTVRDMVYAVVSEKYKTLRNDKNYNNQIGVPLTLFNLNTNYECAVIEMGMCGFNEIEYLADIVRPKIGVISNIGQSHIERLGSQEGIMKAKLELVTYFKEDNVLIVNGDDSYLSGLKKADLNYKLKTFGYGVDNDIYCKKYVIGEDESSFICSIEGNDYEFYLPTAGKHNIYNAMASICVGLEFGMSIEEIKKGLSNFSPTGMRQVVVKKENLTIINDAYNASPDSMKAALDVLGRYKGRRVAILGDIFEMGEYAEKGLREVGKHVINNVDVLITIGENSKYIGLEAMKYNFNESSIHHFENKESVELEKLIKSDDVVLVKASRGMKLEYIVEKLMGE